MQYLYWWAMLLLSVAPCVTLCYPAQACPAVPMPLPPSPHAVKSLMGGFWGDYVSPGNGSLVRKKTTLFYTMVLPLPPESLTE